MSQTLMIPSLHLVASLPAATPPSSNHHGVARRAALLDAVRVKGTATTFCSSPDETQSLLLQLPRELLFAVLMCLSSPTRPARSYYESAVLNLAARRQEAVEAVANARLTCSALFVASEASGVTRDAVVGHLAAWTSALMSRLTPTPSEEDSTLAITAMEEELSSSTTEGDAELLGVSVAAQALRASVVVAGRRIPSSVINMVEKGFDPGANRYACFITARTVTDLPAALAVVAEGQWNEVVTRAFGTPLAWGPHHDKLPGEEALDKSAETRKDAWSSSSSLKLGTLEHVTTEHELENILVSLYKGDKKAKRPPTSEALGLLTQLVGVSPFMMWRDTTPLPKDAPTRNHNEERLVLVGATSACLVQIEYNTNFQIGWAGLTWRMR